MLMLGIRYVSWNISCSFKSLSIHKMVKDELEMSIRSKSQVKLVKIDLETGYQTEKVIPGCFW